MKAQKIWFDDTYIHILTTTGQTGKMPLAWFPRLKNASQHELQEYELWADGSWIHWETLGEDLGADGFFTYKKEGYAEAVTQPC